MKRRSGKQAQSSAPTQQHVPSAFGSFSVLAEPPPSSPPTEPPPVSDGAVPENVPAPTPPGPASDTSALNGASLMAHSPPSEPNGAASGLPHPDVLDGSLLMDLFHTVQTDLTDVRLGHQEVLATFAKFGRRLSAIEERSHRHDPPALAPAFAAPVPSAPVNVPPPSPVPMAPFVPLAPFNLDEVNYVRSVLDRFVTPQREDEDDHRFNLRRREMANLWLGRGQHAEESREAYLKRTLLHQRVFANIAHVEAYGHHRSRASRSASSLTSPEFEQDPRRSLPPADVYLTPGRLATPFPDSRRFANIDNVINEHLGGPPLPPALADALRRVKISLPDKYPGHANPELFQRWLAELCSWLAMQNLRGPDYDRARVWILRGALTGKASEWYYREILSYNRPEASVSFLDAVHRLYDNFVTRASLETAIDDWDALKYDSEEGICGLWSSLRNLADRRPVYPDSFTIARRFLDALPDNIYKHLTVHRGLSATKSPILELVEAAEDIEASMNVADRRQASGEAAAASPAARRDVRSDRRDLPAPKASSRSHTDSPDHPLTLTDQPSDAQKAQPARRSGPNRASSVCYACGAYGHIQTDPQCPKYESRGPRLNMLRVSHNRPDSDHGSNALTEAQPDFNIVADVVGRESNSLVLGPMDGLDDEFLEDASDIDSFADGTQL